MKKLMELKDIVIAVIFIVTFAVAIKLSYDYPNRTQVQCQTQVKEIQ